MAHHRFERRGRHVGRRHVFCLLALGLYAGAVACSPLPSAGSSQPSIQPPRQPDPCTLLTAADISSIYSTDAQAKDFNMGLLNNSGDYDPSLDGVTTECGWSAPIYVSKTGGYLRLGVLGLSLEPAAKYEDLLCDTQVAGIGQEACFDEGALQVKDRFFALLVTDDVSAPRPRDLTVEKELAIVAVGRLRSLAPGS